MGVNPDHVIAELRSLLAAAEARSVLADQRSVIADERSATFQRMMERQGYQLDRMQDQLERSLREIEALRRQLGKPPPDAPKPPASPSTPSGSDTVPEPPITPARVKPPKKKKAKFGRNAISARLKRVPEKPEFGPCTCGAEQWVLIREERTEMYDFVPAQLVVKVIVRDVCRCGKCQRIEMVPFPDHLIPRMRATPGLIGHIIFEKYGRHLPLYRVDKEIRRMGGEVPEQTRDRWLSWAADRLKRLEGPLKALLFAVGLMHTDGTGLAVVQPRLKVSPRPTTSTSTRLLTQLGTGCLRFSGTGGHSKNSRPPHGFGIVVLARLARVPS